MTTGVLVAAAALVGVGAAGAAARSTFRAGLATQAAGAVALGVFGFWALATGTTVGSPFTSSFVLSFGVDGLTAFFLGVLGLVAAPVLVFAIAVPRADGERAGDRRPDGHVSPRPRRGAVRTRPADLPRRLGADDAAPGGDDPRPERGPEREAHRVRLCRDHASRGCGHVDRRPAGGARGRDRRHGGRAGLGPPDRDRACGAGRHGREGGVDAAAQLAAAGAPDRSGAGVGADERRDDQDRDLRARARARRLARRAAALVRRARPRRRCALGGGRCRLRALPARPEASARVPLDRERRDHRARSRRLPAPACARRRRLGGARARSGAACTRSTTRCSRRCCFSGPARSSAASDRSSSTGWAVCFGGCRGPAARFSSVRWRSPGCRL